MSDREQIADFFDGKAVAWDGIYSGDKGIFLRTWDQITRQNLKHRFEFAMGAVDRWEGKRVLDVGCGSGRYCVELATRGASEVVGLDVSPQILDIARDLAQNRGVESRCQFIQQDVMEYEDRDGFDVIIANGFFDYVREPHHVLTHLRQLTRDKLVASFPYRWAFRVPIRWAWLNLHRCPVWFFSRTDIENYCRQAGFACAKLVRKGPIYMLQAEPEANP